MASGITLKLRYIKGTRTKMPSDMYKKLMEDWRTYKGIRPKHTYRAARRNAKR